MIRNLSYIGFNSPAAAEWRTFGPEVLGAQITADGPPDATTVLRVDDLAWRIAVHESETNDLAYLGWDVGDDAGLEQLTARLTAAGIDVTRDDDLAGQRNVDAAAWFVDPIGWRHELSHGLATAAPFVPGRPISGFVTGPQGLGHVVLLVPDLDAGVQFVTEVLGFEPTDSVANIRFFHCPGRASRHHTVALAGVPGMVGLHHLMLETRTLDDVGTGLDIVNARQLPLAMSLGRHTNDLMTSFYVRTPSGFEIEYGTGGVIVDDDHWDVTAFDGPSLWGHRPPEQRLRPQILRPFQPAAASS